MKHGKYASQKVQPNTHYGVADHAFSFEIEVQLWEVLDKTNCDFPQRKIHRIYHQIVGGCILNRQDIIRSLEGEEYEEEEICWKTYPQASSLKIPDSVAI